MKYSSVFVKDVSVLLKCQGISVEEGEWVLREETGGTA
jgi:hypothetical protein